MTDSQKKTNRLYLFIALLFGALLIVWAVTTRDSTSNIDEEDDHDHEAYVKLAPDEALGYGVTLDAAGNQALSIEVIAPGKITLDPDAIAHIVPTSPGIARNVYKNVGENVVQNDLMAVIESREMAEAKASFLAAIKKEQLAASTLQREKNLFDKKISASQDYYGAESQAQEALIELHLTKQRLEALGLTTNDIWDLGDSNGPNLRLYDIRSPIEGMVIKRHITTGEVVGGEQEIFTIANLKNVWVELSVFPRDIDAIKTGQKIRVTSPSGKTGETQVLYVRPIIDEETRTAKVIAVLDNSQGLWAPGSYVNSKIVVDTIPVTVSIPKEAIQQIDGQTAVFIPKDDGFEIRTIKTGRGDSVRFEVIDGLNNGEPIAIGNTFLLKAEHEKHEAEHMD